MTASIVVLFFVGPLVIVPLGQRLNVLGFAVPAMLAWTLEGRPRS